MHRGCQTPFSFLSEEQIAVCINKNKEAYLHIINYFIISKGFFFFWSSTCTSLLWSWSLASLLLLLCRALRDKGALSDGCSAFWGRTSATCQPMKPRTAQMHSTSFMGAWDAWYCFVGLAVPSHSYVYCKSQCFCPISQLHVNSYRGLQQLKSSLTKH